VLIRNRIFAVACIITLALAIGTTTAVFSVIDATLLRPLPYRDPDQLKTLNVLLAPSWDGDFASLYGPSEVELVRWRSAHAFEFIEGLEPRLMALSGSGEPESVNGAAVSSGLFPMLGVEPALGRAFTAEEEHADARLAVASDGFVRRHFVSAASSIGASIVLDDVLYQIVGVMPGSFHPFNDPSEVWIPMHPIVDPARAGNRLMTVVGRLRPGTTSAQAQDELASISVDIGREFPVTNAKAKPMIIDLKEQTFGSQRPALLTLGAATALLLLLACVNVMNLTIGHLAVRQAELAIRSAIGAGRRELVRLQLVETTLLAIVGGVLGIGVMNSVVGTLMSLYTRKNALPIQARIDWRVAAFGMIVTGTVAIVSAVVPALRAHSSVRDGGLVRVSSGRVSGGAWERRARAALVALQVAFAVTLLCGSGVFIASLQRLLANHPGFSSERVWSAQVRLSPIRYPDALARAHFVKTMLERISALPGVLAAGTTQTTFQPNESMQSLAWVEGRTVDAQHPETVHIRHITPGYFGALRIAVVEGRAIDDRDDYGTPAVSMVNARWAKQYWPTESALGHRIRRAGPGSPWLTVVGVTSDIMDNGLGVQPAPTMYVPYLQQNTKTARVTLLVRTSNDSNGYSRDIERAVWSIDSAQPLADLQTLSTIMTASTGDERFRTALMTLFASIGLILAIIGVYGVTSASITTRTREIGIRMALGASGSSVILSVVSESARRVLLGTFMGLALFFGLGRIASSLLYKTSYTDPLILAMATLPLVFTALLISYLQARHLAAVNPVTALQNEI
jgi:predicted permease